MKKATKLLSLLLSLALVAMLIPLAAQAATLTTVTVKKTDVGGNPLAGAVFTLTGTGNSLNKNYNAESGEDGIATFVDVADGTYDLEEAMPPKGYAHSGKVYHVSVYAGVAHETGDPDTGTSDVLTDCFTFVNEKLPTYPVTVKKTDEAGNPLAGAVFTLTGIGNFPGQDYEATSGQDGVATFQVLHGWYRLAEKIAPDGYALSDKTYDITVSNDGVFLIKETDAGYDYPPVENLTYVNKALPTYPVTVKKTDGAGKPLAGAVFTLTGTGNSIGKNYEATSDSDGNAVFHVREGYYTLAEKTAPEGYVKSDKTYEIAVWGGKAHFVKETDNGTDYTDYEAVTYVNDLVKSPKTGDTVGFCGLIVLLAVSGSIAAGAAYSRKKKAE